MKHIKRPCDECPWRVGAESGRFSPERWVALAATSISEETHDSPTIGSPLFGCHKTPEGGERACAGWLAVEGMDHPTVRLALAFGNLPPEAVTPGEDWPELYRSFGEAARADLDGSNE